MKTLHPARRRFVIGVILLVMTFLGTLQEGAIGHIWARAVGYLFGQTGAAVLAVAMLVVGLAFVLPRDFLGQLVRWSWNGREARVDRVRREMDVATRKPIVVEEPTEEPALAPVDRRTLDAVRDALKQLGYKEREYEKLVRAMDPRQTFESLVKGALRQLAVVN